MSARPRLRWFAFAAALFVIPGSLAARWYASSDRLSVRSAIERAGVMLHEQFDRTNVAAIEEARTYARADDWSTFAHDDRRSGMQRQPTRLTRDSVGSLTRRWMQPLGEHVRASPIVAGGSVYIATELGNVYALDAASGEIRWRAELGGSVRMTPALAHGALLVGIYGAMGAVGTKPQKAAFVSLDAASGAVRWRTPLPGLVRAEPVVLDGVVYEGLAGGDSFTGCFDGRIVALDERTGKLLPNVWRTSARSGNGGGVWGPLSTDGSTIYFGTGNTCDESPAGMGDSIVAVDRALHDVWHTSARVAGVDDSDVGGGVALAGPRAYVAGKSGYLYELERETGRILARRDLQPWARNGGSIGTPTGDGNVLVISGGEKSDPDHPTSPGCVITGFDLGGRVLYRLHSEQPVSGYAAFVPGVGFIVLDRVLVAFGAMDGKQLWSASLGDFGYASPVVVPSGVYAVSNAGDVFAFGLRPGSTPSIAQETHKRARVTRRLEIR